MKQHSSKEEAVKEAIYFYDRNYIIMIGGAAIVLGSTVFWTVYNLLTNDSMCYISSGAIWSEIAMIAASAAIILIVALAEVTS